MSEYEKNGGSHPDKGGTWSGPVSDDAPSQPGSGAAETQSGTQDAPLQDMHATTVNEKIEGIVAQSRSDYAGNEEMDLPLLVRRRLEDAGIQASDEDIQRVVDRVRDVDDGTRIEPGVHDTETFFTGVAITFEALGAVAMMVGTVIAAVLCVRSLRRQEGGQVAFATLRNTLGAAILLGLEVLVAADLIRTITSKPSLNDALILGLIVLIRTVLSFSIQVEIEGIAPWRRALLTSGGQLIGESVARDRRARAAPDAR